MQRGISSKNQLFLLESRMSATNDADF
jgi:hypothetical protein